MIGHKDVDMMVMEQLSDRDLLNLCSASKMTHSICQNETFWRKRTEKKYDIFSKDDKRTWRNFYLAILRYQDTPGQGILDLSYKWGSPDTKRYLENNVLVEYLKSLLKKHIETQLLKHVERINIPFPKSFINKTVNNLYNAAAKSGDLDMLDGEIPKFKLDSALVINLV